MPHSEIHKKKFRKNLMVGGMILLWIVLIWAVTMIKIARADEFGPVWRGRNYSGVGVGSHPSDTRGDRYDDRLEYLQKTEETGQKWLEEYHEGGDGREDMREQDGLRRYGYQDKVRTTGDTWHEEWMDGMDARFDEAEADQQRRIDYQDTMTLKPQDWWNDWTVKQEKKREAEE